MEESTFTNPGGNKQQPYNNNGSIAALHAPSIKEEVTNCVVGDGENMSKPTIVCASSYSLPEHMEATTTNESLLKSSDDETSANSWPIVDLQHGRADVSNIATENGINSLGQSSISM